MLRALGAAGEALWVPDVGLPRDELNARALWGAVAAAGEDAAATHGSAREMLRPRGAPQQGITVTNRALAYAMILAPGEAAGFPETAFRPDLLTN